MVSEGILSQPSNRISISDEEDRISTSSSIKDETCDGAIILQETAVLQDVPSFGNISVSNSNDVHFGNKTFYNGPVTIKQFLYANNGGDNNEIYSAIKNSSETVNNEFEIPVFRDEFYDVKNSSTPKHEAQQDLTRNSEIFKGLRWFQKFSQDNFIILVSLLAILMVSLGVLMVVLLVKHSPLPVDKTPVVPAKQNTEEQNVNTPIQSPIDPNVNLTLSSKLKIVTRLEWLAQPPVEPSTPLSLPVPYVIIHHTATENCSSQAQCIFHVRYIQTFHIESRNWWDIAYNFLVGGNGEVYEGRGWKGEGSHSYGYNSRSIGIAFIGTFNSFKPPQRQIDACKKLIAQGVELGYIQKNYKILAARQLQTTQSPGAVLYENIKTWNHWAKNP